VVHADCMLMIAETTDDSPGGTISERVSRQLADCIRENCIRILIAGVIDGGNCNCTTHGQGLQRLGGEGPYSQLCTCQNQYQ